MSALRTNRYPGKPVSVCRISRSLSQQRHCGLFCYLLVCSVPNRYTAHFLYFPKYCRTFKYSFGSGSLPHYSLIFVTTPEPTVLPPSRIAKRRPSSIAIGVIRSTSIVTLSPGMHISLSAGRVITPVTSVVLKKN